MTRVCNKQLCLANFGMDLHEFSLYHEQWIIYKWKNHFSEMKGDVGMSLHEKEGEQEDA